jgi:putative endonuclease
MKLSTYARGFLSEYLSAVMLTVKGYQVLNMRYRNRMGEVDIIARKGRTIVFVEVKSIKRPGIGFPVVGPTQIARIQRAASLYLAQREALGCYEPRFDLITVSGFASIKHHKNAF